MHWSYKAIKSSSLLQMLICAISSELEFVIIWNQLVKVVVILPPGTEPKTCAWMKFFIDHPLMSVKYIISNYCKHDYVLNPAASSLYIRSCILKKTLFVCRMGHRSHTFHICQSYLKGTLGRGMFVTKSEWPPKFPDLNPHTLDYYFWDRGKDKVYKGRSEPFKNLEWLRWRIKTCLTKAALNLEEIRCAISQIST